MVSVKGTFLNVHSCYYSNKISDLPGNISCSYTDGNPPVTIIIEGKYNVVSIFTL